MNVRAVSRRHAGLANTGWFRMFRPSTRTSSRLVPPSRERTEHREVQRTSRQDRRTGCGRCFRNGRPLAARRRPCRNTCRFAPILPSVVHGRRRDRRSAGCSACSATSPLAVTVNGVPLNAPNTPLICQSLDDALQRCCRSCRCSATAAGRRSPAGSCACGRTPPGAQLRSSSLGVLQVRVAAAVVVARHSSPCPACTRP